MNGSPYYKLCIMFEDADLYKNNFSIWDFVPFFKKQEQSITFKISMSPGNQMLACLHTNGTVSLWRVPTLKLQKQWKLMEQPDFNKKNPNQSVKLYNNIPKDYSEFHPFDIKWWSDNVSFKLFSNFFLEKSKLTEFFAFYRLLLLQDIPVQLQSVRLAVLKICSEQVPSSFLANPSWPNSARAKDFSV